MRHTGFTPGTKARTIEGMATPATAPGLSVVRVSLVNDQRGKDDQMAWFHNLKVRTRLLIGFGLVLAIFLTLSMSTFLTIQHTRDSSHWVDHTHQVITLADEAQTAVLNMEAGLRGFLISGRDEFLEPYNDGRREYQMIFQQLRQLTVDNSSQVQRWQSIEQRTQGWLQTVAEPQIQTRRDVNAGRGTFDDISRMVTGG